MKLHDLRPPEGSRKERIRVGRGIAAGKGKTAGRGTKGQKARAGGSIPPWFEGGQTPLHMRIPKLRGFKNRFRIEFEVVNIGAIGALADAGAFESEAPAKGKGKSAPAQITINQDILRAVGLVRTLNKPLKILGNGELSAALFVVADAFTASARTKIEAAGGTVSVLEVPTAPLKAIGLETEDAAPRPAKSGAATATAIDVAPEAAPAEAVATPDAAVSADADEVGGDETATEPSAATEASAKPAKTRAKKAKATADVAAETADDAAEATADTPQASEGEAETETPAAETDEAATTSGDDA